MIKKMALIIVIIFLFIPSFLCFAQTDSINPEQDELVKDQFEASGIKDLYEILPKDAKRYFSSNDIDDLEYDTFSKFNFLSFIKGFFINLKEEVTKPLKLLFILLGIILLSALINSFKVSMEDSTYLKAYNIASVLSVCGVLVSPIIDIIQRSASTIKDVSSFILMFLPVFVGVLIASGKTLSGFAYNTFLFGAVQVISQISSTVLVPLLGIYLAFCLCGSVTDYIRIDAISAFIQKTVTWVMGILLTIFVSLLTLQGIVTTSADTVSIKAAKFALGSFVPVIGGALSEAFNSIQGCISFIKSTVGVFGILACILTFVPLIISILLLILSLNVSSTVADILHLDKIPSILKACSSTLSLMLAIVICFAVLLIVSTTVMLILGISV